MTQLLVRLSFHTLEDGSSLPCQKQHNRPHFKIYLQLNSHFRYTILSFFINAQIQLCAIIPPIPWWYCFVVSLSLHPHPCHMAFWDTVLAHITGVPTTVICLWSSSLLHSRLFILNLGSGLPTVHHHNRRGLRESQHDKNML